jgi:hypothetical protein
MIAKQSELMARQEMWSRAGQFTHLTYGYTPFNVYLTQLKNLGGWRKAYRRFIVPASRGPSAPQTVARHNRVPHVEG